MDGMSQSAEDYLEAVLRLEEKGERVTVTAVAALLTVSKPAVTKALKELDEKGLAVYHPYGEIALTDQGRHAAEAVFEKHNLIKEFLLYIGVGEQTAERDCCKVEHALSRESFCRIKKLYDELKNKKQTIE